MDLAAVGTANKSAYRPIRHPSREALKRGRDAWSSSKTAPRAPLRSSLSSPLHHLQIALETLPHASMTEARRRPQGPDGRVLPPSRGAVQGVPPRISPQSPCFGLRQTELLQAEAERPERGCC